MVAAQVDDVRILFLELGQNVADELRVLLRPLRTPAQLPSVDDVSVENKLLRRRVAKKMVHLFDLGIGRSKVHIRDDDRSVGNDCFLHAKGRTYPVRLIRHDELG